MTQKKDTGMTRMKITFLTGGFSALSLLIRFQVRLLSEGKSEKLHHVLAFVRAITLFRGLLC